MCVVMIVLTSIFYSWLFAEFEIGRHLWRHADVDSAPWGCQKHCPCGFVRLWVCYRCTQHAFFSHSMDLTPFKKTFQRSCVNNIDKPAHWSSLLCSFPHKPLAMLVLFFSLSSFACDVVVSGNTETKIYTYNQSTSSFDTAASLDTRYMLLIDHSLFLKKYYASKIRI